MKVAKKTEVLVVYAGVVGKEKEVCVFQKKYNSGTLYFGRGKLVGLVII